MRAWETSGGVLAHAYDAQIGEVIKSDCSSVSIAVLTLSLSVAAQQPVASPPIKRTLLQRVDVPGSANMETVTGVAEIMPNVNIGRHTHFGAELDT